MNHLKSFAAVVVSFATSLAAFAAAPADFTVTSPIDGKSFRLSEAKGRYVALHFLLKTECPLCLRHTAEYSMKATCGRPLAKNTKEAKAKTLPSELRVLG